MKRIEVARKAKLTGPGVKYKRDRGETDEEIIAGKGKSNASGETLAAAQLRKEQALADLRELEVKEKQGLLIPLADAIAAGAYLSQLTRQRISTIPNTVAAVCAASTSESEVKGILAAEIEKQLQHLNNDFLTASEADSAGSGGSDTAAELQAPVRY